MNVFVIPSWYPSEKNLSYGIFVQEQIQMMAKLRPGWNIGVSCWGQGDREKLLWARDHFKNIGKLKKHSLDRFEKNNKGKITEYYQPALSWTKRFRNGNLNEIIRCNQLNFQHFELEFGKPDLVLVQASYPGALIGKHLSERYTIPYIVHVRMGGFMFENLLNQVGGMKSDLINAINQANIALVTSEFQSHELKEWIPESHVLNNPVDTSFFKVKDSKGDYMVAIGRLEEEKGFDLLIDAMRKVPKVKLKVGGSGSQEADLKRMAKEYQLADRIEFLGELNREEVKEVISNSSFLVLPSKYETFGNVLLEAMASGKPVVATKCGGSQEIVHPKTGFLCEVDANDLADKITRMIEHREQFKSNDISAFVENRFSPESWIDQLEQHFQSVKE